MLAIEAFSAEGFHIHCYPVTWFHMGYILTHFLHNAHHLMPYGNTWHRARNATMLDVEIAGTDTAQSNLHDGIMCIQYNRLFLFCEAKFTLSYICICLHLILIKFLTEFIQDNWSIFFLQI